MRLPGLRSIFGRRYLERWDRLLPDGNTRSPEKGDRYNEEASRCQRRHVSFRKVDGFVAGKDAVVRRLFVDLLLRLEGFTIVANRAARVPDVRGCQEPSSLRAWPATRLGRLGRSRFYGRRVPHFRQESRNACTSVSYRSAVFLRVPVAPSRSQRRTEGE